MLRRDFWDRFNEATSIQTATATDTADFSDDSGEITREDIIRELNSRNYFAIPTRVSQVPVFILQEDKLRQLGFLKKRESYTRQIGKFLGKVWDIIRLKPVDKFKMTPFGVSAHAHYWVITQHPEWFNIAGMDYIMPTPEEWEDWKKQIYRFFTDREIRLSNQDKVVFMAELIWTGASKKKANVMAEAKAVEEGLYEEYKASYSKAEVDAALFLAVLKYWILCKSIRPITPEKEWKFKLRPFGYQDRYAFYTACRVGYQKRIKEALRLATLHRAIEILFCLGVDWAIIKNIAKKSPEIAAYVACISDCISAGNNLPTCLLQCLGLKAEVTPEEETREEAKEEAEKREEAEVPWQLIAAAVGLLLLAGYGD